MTDGRSIPEGRVLAAAGVATPSKAPKPRLGQTLGYGLGLGLLALGLLVALCLLSSRAAFYAVLVSGAAGALVLGSLARGERRRARADRGSSAGRIVESRQGEGHVLFLLPGLSLEPWRADAWVLWVYSVSAACLGGSWLGRAAGFWQVLLLGLLAARVVASTKATFRIELEPGRWLVEAVILGRVLRCSGRGALMPDLTPDALLLWSDAGRVAVLRWELEGNERQWLSERLTHYLESENLPAIAQRSDQVDRG